MYMQHEDPKRTKALLELLRAVIDPIALMGWIDKRTNYGAAAGDDPWQYTREFLARYNLAEQLPAIVEGFEHVGVSNELDASVWLAEHENLIP
jgi:hypothetical protein